LPGTLHETAGLIRAAGGEAIPIAADLGDAADRQALIDEILAMPRSVDILVNNAGLTNFAPTESMQIEIFDQTLDHYLRVPFLLSQAFIPGMKKKGAGWIVNVGSVAALRPTEHNVAPGDVIYAACKAALARFTQGLARELLESNIAVNLVAPSTAVRTPGAMDVIPQGYPTEDVAYLAETALALSHLPAKQRSGALTFSMHFPHAHKLDVYSLDGSKRLPDEVPPLWAHPDIEFHSR
jgi:NAD(P)-dependent dehydrogenase (short-subunit alcohol dehydrogenase family)